MEDRRAHERITTLEEILRNHVEGHVKFEAAIAENTKLTQTIADNTSEIVALVKGAKGLRSLMVWATPLVVAILAVWGWLKVMAK